jgi:hypothetical protein
VFLALCDGDWLSRALKGVYITVDARKVVFLALCDGDWLSRVLQESV